MFNVFDIGSYVEAASSYAAEIDQVILIIAALVGGPFIIAEILLIGFAIKFRKKEGVKARYITGEEKEAKRWVTYPHYLVLIFDIAIIVLAVQIWVKVKQDLPPADHTIVVTAQQWGWVFSYPGPDGEFDTADDIRTSNKLHVENEKVYHFKLRSKDVLHDFSVPVFRLKQDIIPGREIVGWFKPIKTGEHDIQCAEMCGIGHGLMAARISIMDSTSFNDWMTKQRGVEVTLAQ
jgi:cytochrome c oxidase subunit 2